MKGRVCLVTGASSGIGLETARMLAARGASVRIVGRNAQRTEEAEAVVRRAAWGGDVVSFRADFSSLQDVRQLARDLLARDEPLHVLINNAGVWHQERKLSRDGFEDTFAVNHLAPFLLTRLLVDRMREADHARIVHVSSRLHEQAGQTGPLGRALYLVNVLGIPVRSARGGLALDDLAYEHGYRGLEAYARSKLAQILFSNELARRLEGTGVTSNSVHPGSVNTNVVRDNRLLVLGSRIAAPFLKTPEQGAATSVHVACEARLREVTGGYFADSRQKEAAPSARDATVARALWRISSEMVGVSPEGVGCAP